ncbi:GreA/GreB family elongation factor [Dyella japonica]|uniref:Transcription elongation GreA/GreB family factor n=1 Tax=Dyella japonica TaxID=231455 RepID=A0ABV2JSP0_9GAMM
MSRSFVKDADESVGERLPDIPLSEHPNYVTPRGLAQLRARLVALRDRRDALRAAADTLPQQRELADVERELRWLNTRVGSAIEIEPAQQPRDRVAFGALVTVDSEEGEARYRIVGEDEADVEHGLVSYVSPLAAALLGSRMGDEVTWQRPAGDLAVEIVAIEYPKDD